MLSVYLARTVVQMFAGLSKPTQKLKNISLFTEGGRTVRETCSNKAVIQLLHGGGSPTVVVVLFQSGL
jgi:hypothetical protein